MVNAKIIFVLLLLYKPFCLFVWFVKAHAKVCLYAFDSIYDVPPFVENVHEYRKNRAKSAEQRIHRFFILPICVWLFLALDTLWIMWMHNFDYLTVPELFTHRLYAPKFWPQGDMLLLTASTGILLNGLVFLCNTWLDDRFCMYFVKGPNGHDHCLIVNGIIWNRENSQKLYKFRRQSKKILLPMAMSSFLLAYLFYVINIVQCHFDRFMDYVKMVLIVPIFAWYAVLVCSTMFCHFFIITKYVLIKQSYLLGLQNRLLTQLKVTKFGKTSNRALFKHSQSFRSINSMLAYQCAEIRAYNHFWSAPVSILFGVDMVAFCYLLFTFLFYKKSMDQFVHYFFFLLELGVFIFAEIYLASLVDRNNSRFYERNVKACVAFEMINFPRNQHSIQRLININKIATNRNFTKCCFRLANGYRLDSTAFNMALLLISSIFLSICKQNQRK